MSAGAARPEAIVASIVIATRNRREETLAAVASSFGQSGVPLEVLVYDDASDDGTAEAVQHAFPAVRIFANPERTGYIVSRNRGFCDARGAYVFSLDDDATFSRADIVARIVAQFERDPSIGAIAIPFVEPLKPQTRSSSSVPVSSLPEQELRNYIGCAHAVRRDVALRLGGYREFFVHQVEERDFCLRLWAGNHRVVYGASGHIVHSVSPKRDSGRIMYYGFRNQILTEILNAPLPDLLLRLPVVACNAIRFQFAWRLMPLKLKAIGAGLLEGVRRRRVRQPVSRAVYRRLRKLVPHGPGADFLSAEAPDIDRTSATIANPAAAASR